VVLWVVAPCSAVVGNFGCRTLSILRVEFRDQAHVSTALSSTVVLVANFGAFTAVMIHVEVF
jgi:hypothetical protein